MAIQHSNHDLQSAGISKVAFWDVDIQKVDMERDSLSVMYKIFNYGAWNDIIAVLHYYGLERIKREVVEVPWLKKTALSFLCLILDLKQEDFVAMQRRDSVNWNLK